MSFYEVSTTYTAKHKFVLIEMELKMCNTTRIRNWLIAVLGAIGAASAAIVSAIITNHSILGAWMSPGWMLVAAASAGLAIIFCGQAMAALDTFVPVLENGA